MPGPRFQHGYAHDVFVSYTHADNQLDQNRWNWVTRFTRDLHARLEVVSGHSVAIWRDEQKLGAADPFHASIGQAIENTAILLVVLSPTYFNSGECLKEREAFYRAIAARGRVTAGGKARVLKVAKFEVPLEAYPADLKTLLEHRFYDAGPPTREFHMSEDGTGDRRYGALAGARTSV